MASNRAASKGLGPDAAEPATIPSTHPHDTGNMKEGPSMLSSSDTVTSGGATNTATPVGKRRAPAGLAAVYNTAHCSRMGPGNASVEGLGSSAGESLTHSSGMSSIPSTHPLVDSCTTSSLPPASGMAGIPVGLAPGMTPALSDKPILPASQSPPAAPTPAPAPAEATLAPPGPTSTPAGPIAAPVSTTRTPASPAPAPAPAPVPARVTPAPAGITSIDASGPANLRPTVASSPVGSFIARPGRQASMGLPAATPAVRVPSTTHSHLPAAKPDQTARVSSTSRNSTNGKKTISVNASAETKPTAPHTLTRRSSSIKEKIHKVRTQLGKLTNQVKNKTSKKSSTKDSGSTTKGSLKGNTLERHGSWKSAVKAVEGGFTRRSTGGAVVR